MSAEVLLLALLAAAAYALLARWTRGRRAGSQTHRAIGRQTDFVRAASATQTVLLLAIGAIVLLLAALALRGLA